MPWPRPAASPRSPSTTWPVLAAWAAGGLPAAVLGALAWAAVGGLVAARRLFRWAPRAA